MEGKVTSDVRDNRYNLPYRDYDNFMSFSYIDISSHSNLTNL